MSMKLGPAFRYQNKDRKETDDSSTHVGAGFAVFLWCLPCGPEFWSRTWICETEQDENAMQTMMPVALSFHVGPCPHVHAPHTLKQSCPRPLLESMSQYNDHLRADIVTNQNKTDLLVLGD